MSADPNVGGRPAPSGTVENGAGRRGGRARPMPGVITVTPNRRRSSQSDLIDSRPSRVQKAAMVAGEQLAHDLLATGFPATLAGQADALATWCDPIVTEFADRLDRRGVAFLEASARHLVTHQQPAGLRFASHAALSAALAANQPSPSAAETDGEPDEAPELVGRRRPVWVHRDGVEGGLLLDRVHYASRPGHIEVDRWVRGKVADDLRRALTYLRHTLPTTDADQELSRVLGVRVLSHRVPYRSVHFPAARTQEGDLVVGAPHTIGDCWVCDPSHETGRSLLDSPTQARPLSTTSAMGSTAVAS
ncbi:hypothetical protein KLP28_08670 [Nocardioidaceae bacterium]|nr:hypothetical protein KLP28_08670 [Nocardioidaceae bacterium]